MRVVLTDDHEGEGAFPVFAKGSPIINFEPCGEYSHWFNCSINGVNVYVPDIYVEKSCLAVDYDPTELVVQKGDTVNVLKIIYEWVYAVTYDGFCGWLPAKKLVSVE